MEGAAGAAGVAAALSLRKLGQADEALQNPGVGAPGRRRGGQQAARQSPLLQAALGHLGLGDTDQAKQEFRATLAINPAHVWARSILDSLGR